MLGFAPRVLGFIFHNGQPRNPYMGVHVYWVLFFITDNRIPYMGVGVYWVLFFVTDNQENHHGCLCVLVFFFIMDKGFIFYNGQPRYPSWKARCTGFYFL